MSRSLLPATLSVLLLAACATPVAIDRAEHSLEAELRAFQELQRVFRAENIGAHTFDFEGHGRVTVREITLDGFPGHAYVRCRFHYQNRTVKRVVQSWVSLDVLDASGQVVATQAAHCIVPVPVAIERGAYISDELRTPTYGVHLQPGWTWRIRCVADLEQPEEPLDPPAPPGGVPVPTPFLIKDRNWQGN